MRGSTAAKRRKDEKRALFCVFPYGAAPVDRIFDQWKPGEKRSVECGEFHDDGMHARRAASRRKKKEHALSG